MKNKSFSLILGLLMLAALAGGLMLVEQNQNTQKGAYFAGSTLFLQPTEITGEVGSTIPVALYINTGNEAKLSAADVTVCYDTELELNESDPTAQMDLNKDALGQLVSVDMQPKIQMEGAPKCVRIVTIADIGVKPDDLKSGTVRILTINFSAKENGTGKLAIKKSSTKIGGYNPVAGAKDVAIELESATGATYNIGGGSEPTPTSPPSGEELILNYKVSFAYVKAGDNKCLVNWPLQVIVLGAGESKVYSNVIPDSKTEVDDKVVFQGSLPLVGFHQANNVAVFIKGPKHLQRKYAIQNQSGPYNKAGGELTLTKSAATSPLYDFTAYPLLAGDVIGATSESQDGWISGVDYSYIKTKADVHDTVAEGAFLKGDLDGNCQINSNDVNELKISLEQKQEELY